MENYISSEEAAKQIGVTLDNLYMWLSRHPEHRPKKRFGRSYLWSNEDVTRVMDERAKEDLPVDSE